MKCIKATKSGKYQKIGEIKRVEDSDAYAKVSGGSWTFVSKKEWKESTRKQSEEDSKKEAE